MLPNVLPAYSEPIQPPPSYTRTPWEDEQTLAFTPRPGMFNRQGKYVKHFKKTIVILTEQDENILRPTYSRGGVVRGEVSLDCPDTILEVSAKLYGQMSLMAAENGSGGATLISDRHTLWNIDAKRSKDKSSPKCPSILPFAIPIPITYTSPNGKTSKLPPSFESHVSGIPALFARCSYSLSFTIVKTKRSKLASWTVSKTFNITIEHRPRTRPQRPVVLVGSILSSLKPVPEEWLQIMVTTVSRLGSAARPIECHLLIPSVQAFAIADPIPFHLQLCSSRTSIHELLPPNSSLLDPEGQNMHPNGSDGVRLSIVRQIHVEIAGRRSFRTLTIGTSWMCPVPPAMTEAYPSDEIRLDWQGELKCLEDVTCGSFTSGALSVKDFLVLVLSPSTHSPLVPLRVTHPIRLVTDSWADSPP